MAGQVTDTGWSSFTIIYNQEKFNNEPLERLWTILGGGVGDHDTQCAATVVIVMPFH